MRREIRRRGKSAVTYHAPVVHRIVAALLGLLAGLAVGIALGLAIAPASFDAQDRPADDPAAARVETPDAPAARRAETARAAVEAPQSAGPSAGRSVQIAPDVREIALPGAAEGLATMEIEVRDADGAPVDDREVYALPAGSKGTDEEDEVFLAETDDMGRARLDLPSPAVYDVGVRAWGCVLRRIDVPSPAPGVVTFVVPPTATVRVVVADDAVVSSGEEVRFSTALPDGSLNYPGRHDVGYWQTEPKVPDSREFAVELPTGQEYLLTPPPHLVAVPPVVRAPGEVRLRPVESNVVPVVFTFEPPDHAWPHWVRLTWTVLADGAPPETMKQWVGPDKPVGGYKRLHTVVTPRARGEIQWSGDRIEPGSLAFAATDGARLTAVVRISQRPPDPATHARVRVVAEPDDAGTDDGLVSLHVGYDPDGDVVATRVPPGEETVLDVEGEWAIALGSPAKGSGRAVRVGGPARLRGGELAEIPLREGGHVVFAPTTLPPATAGTVWIARADGGPLLELDDDGDLESERRVAAIAGTVLGPFEPGDVTLDLCIGPTTWRRFVVTVRPGEYSVLRVPAFPTVR